MWYILIIIINHHSKFILGDLENVLRKLSLEKYQPIFEEQEVSIKPECYFSVALFVFLCLIWDNFAISRVTVLVMYN